MNSCFLDTSAALDMLRGRSSAWDAAEPYEQLLISFAAWGELSGGAWKANDAAVELDRLENFVGPSQIIGADQETASIYGELLADLERRGRRIPTNDIWIAATAVQFDLPLLARDGHFGRLPQLRWVAY